MNKKWTPEEIQFLEERWGTISVKAIAVLLNRSMSAVRGKATQIQLVDKKGSSVRRG
jgi:hypothetical protein